ncbi:MULTISPECIES: DUF4040 domain-containing protein [unclassified Streptomyces]|uniref:Na(+)/H(+) antiporter subunit B n=1 Tax=unclassified Streptomyces TaxID=2593676 RepID=UPI00225024D3|nr:DUF4040 domain-containing protein [Streptomyces sp. NBC_00047]MCX5613452.1 DUF4040 domain-containing protein [Streptomyces sp. NBC_00047]
MADATTALCLLLVVVAATAAVLCRDPVRQAVVLAVLGLLLALLFTLFQAPDVALSQLAVGSALTPLLILLTARKVRRGAAQEQNQEDRGQAEGAARLVRGDDA